VRREDGEVKSKVMRVGFWRFALDSWTKSDVKKIKK
jgi:hypothetical protein